MLKVKTVQQINCRDWDDLVKETYNKPYCFQQQEGCQERGVFSIQIPDESDEDEMNESIPLQINGDEMGVKFDVWLNTDPQTHKDAKTWSSWELELFWERNFYPNIQTVANDLQAKGLIEAGKYDIKIDW